MKDNSNTRKALLGSALFASMALVATSTDASSAFAFTELGNGAQVRSELLSDAVTPADYTASKYAEFTCGEKTTDSDSTKTQDKSAEKKDAKKKKKKGKKRQK